MIEICNGGTLGSTATSETNVSDTEGRNESGNVTKSVQNIETTISIAVRTYKVAQGKPVPLPFPPYTYVRARHISIPSSSPTCPFFLRSGNFPNFSFLSIDFSLYREMCRCNKIIVKVLSFSNELKRLETTRVQFSFSLHAKRIVQVLSLLGVQKKKKKICFSAWGNHQTFELRFMIFDVRTVSKTCEI